MVDLAIAGHLSGDAAALIGAISVGTTLFDLLYWNFGFLRVGTGGMTAQAFGRRDAPEMAAILFRGMGLAFMVAACMLLLQWPFAKVAILLMDCSPEVADLALEYFFIRIWAAPATLSLFSLKGWFIGMQDTFSSMTTDLVVNGVNIVVSLLLALKTPLGFAGIALGTVIAQWTGLLTGEAIVAFKYGHKVFNGFKLKDIAQAIKGGQLRRFLSVSGDLFVRSVGLVVVYVGFTAIAARQGDLMLASSSIMMKLLLIFSYFTDGFAYAGEAMVGKYIGRADEPNTRRTVRLIFAWSFGIGLFFIGIYYLAGVPILHLLTSDGNVIEACRLFFFWLLPMPLIGCAAFTWDGVYVGATASREMRDSTIWCVAAFFVTWFAGIALFGLPGSVGEVLPGATVAQVRAVHILFAAYFAHLAARALYQTVLYKKAVLKQFDNNGLL